MKVICDAPGQTCNRLWSYVATIAECIIKREKMMIFFFDYSIEDFPNFKHCPFIYFPLYQEWYLEHGNGWNNFKGLTWKATHSKELDKIYNFFGFFKGWNTRRKIEYISDAKKEIIHIFTPRTDIVQKGTCLISEMRSSADIIVGVHIRRGDYEMWNNGKFYYSLSQYYTFMQKIQALYSTQKVAFFISSNEKVQLDLFSKCNCFLQEKSESPILDLYTLSLCDRIIGPFSTFSRWASFYGNKPLCFLKDIDQNFTEESFSPIVDYFHFANGKEIQNW